MNELINDIDIATRDYIDTKLDLEMQEADLWLNTDWNGVLNKAKPTQKDKEYYIKKEINGAKSTVEHNRARVDHLKRKYEVKLLEYKFSLEDKGDEQ